jgi:small-conductance mechanosensitive channel
VAHAFRGTAFVAVRRIMQGFLEYIQRNLGRLGEPLGVAAASIIILLIARGFLLRALHNITKRRQDRLDSGLVSLLKTPSFFWVIAVGLYTGIAVSDLAPRYSKPLFQSIHVLIIFSATLVAANLAGLFFRNFMYAPGSNQPRSGLAVGIVKGSVTVLGALWILSLLGVSITPVLTALGVGGLAVALALKDTLENLFAGIYLITDRTIRVGDIIKLESGLEGVVDDIGWRTTKIRSCANSAIIVPNSKLAQSVVTNYCLPDKRYQASFGVVVSAGSDADRVEKIIREILGKASEDITGILSKPDPSVRFIPGMIWGALEFTVSYQVKEYGDLGFTQHEIKKRIFRGFKEQGIELPAPLLRP